MRASDRRGTPMAAAASGQQFSAAFRIELLTQRYVAFVRCGVACASLGEWRRCNKASKRMRFVDDVANSFESSRSITDGSEQNKPDGDAIGDSHEQQHGLYL